MRKAFRLFEIVGSAIAMLALAGAVASGQENPVCGTVLHIGDSTYTVGAPAGPSSCERPSPFNYPLLGSPSGLARRPGHAPGVIPFFFENVTPTETWITGVDSRASGGRETVVFDSTFGDGGVPYQQLECQDVSLPELELPYLELTNEKLWPVFGGSGVVGVYVLWAATTSGGDVGYGPIGRITARSTDVDGDGDTDEADEGAMRAALNGSDLAYDLDWSGSVNNADLQILLEEARRRDVNGNPFGRKHCMGLDIGGYDPALHFSVTPPSAPSSFTASANCGTWKLSWINGGDDGSSQGDPYQVDVRYSSTSAITTEWDWDHATPLGIVPAGPRNTPTTFQTNVTSSTSAKHFAVRAIDDVGTRSTAFTAQSFSVTELTPPATTTGMTAVRLNGGGPGGQARIRWTSAGDDGNAGTPTSYDLRWSDAPITSANFAGATQLLPSPAPVAPGTLVTTFFPMDACTQYYFALKTIDDQGNCSGVSNSPTVFSSCTSGLTAELEGNPELPTRLELSVRNPEGEGVMFDLSIPADLNGADAKLEIMDVLGRKVATIVDGMQPAGRRTVAWGLTTNSGARAPIGVYAARLVVGGTSHTAKFTVLR